MKLYINHTYYYQSQHISMLFFSHVDVYSLPKDSVNNDELSIVSKVSVTDKDVVITASIYENGCLRSSDEQIKHLNADDAIYKYAVVVTLFNTLVAFTGKRPSWGILTGVRPTKRYHALLSSGMSESEVREYFAHHDFVSPKKVALLKLISEQSHRYIHPINHSQASLYIGIPFCPSKCVYCSFTTSVKNKGDNSIERYVMALINHITTTSELYKDKVIQTIYVGGGTPAMLTNDQIVRIHNALTEHYDLSKLQEFTFEAGRPELIDDNLLMTLKRVGVTRICINPQTMHDATLKNIGRSHNTAAIYHAFDVASKYNFTINADAIVGLMDETVEQSIASLKDIMALKPQNITLHTLSLKRGSILNNNLDDYVLMSQEDVAMTVDQSHQLLINAGYLPYYMYRQKYISGNLENVGYTKKGYENIYNIQMIEEKQTVIAFGAGTTSKLYHADNSLIRHHNTKNIAAYIEDWS